MRLIDLRPEFFKWIDDTHSQRVETLAEADGLFFLCPKCFEANNRDVVGVHGVLCWSPHVPQSTSPGPGRWSMQGTGFEDLTLVAGSSSVLLTGGCCAHFFVREGEIVGA